jgi:hypothetical protein
MTVLPRAVAALAMTTVAALAAAGAYAETHRVPDQP